MKTTLFILIVLFVFACQPKTSKETEKFEVFRGTNVAHWLSQSRARGVECEEFLTKTDIVAIAEMGFDQIRLPIDEETIAERIL